MTREQMIDLAVHSTVWKGLAYRSMTRAFFEIYDRNHGIGHWALLFADDVRTEFRRLVEARRYDSTKVMRLGQTNDAKWHRHQFDLASDYQFVWCDICRKIPDTLVAEG